MSDYDVMMFGKFVLTFGVLLAIPLVELYRLRRARKRSARRQPTGAAAATATHHIKQRN